MASPDENDDRTDAGTAGAEPDTGRPEVTPAGGPEHIDAGDEQPASFGGDDDLAAGHLDELGDGPGR